MRMTGRRIRGGLNECVRGKNLNTSMHAPCPICGDAGSRLFCEKDGIDYHSCGACGHVFVLTPTSVELVSDFYRSRQSHHSSGAKTEWDYSDAKRTLVYKPLL